MLQSHLQIELNLHESSLPIFSDVKFSDLSVTALVTNGSAIFSNFFAHIHGGAVTGKGILDWKNGWKLQGQLNARNMELQKMFPNMGLSGELLGEMNILLTSTTLVHFDKSYYLDGSFTAANGVIAKLDLESTVRFGMRPGVAGHTNFNELSGTIRVDSLGQHITVGKLATVSASSTGNINLDASKQLSGKLQVEIKSLGSNKIPLQLSGTLTAPVLQLTR